MGLKEYYCEVGTNEKRRCFSVKDGVVTRISEKEYNKKTNGDSYPATYSVHFKGDGFKDNSHITFKHEKGKTYRVDDNNLPNDEETLRKLAAVLNTHGDIKIKPSDKPADRTHSFDLKKELQPMYMKALLLASPVFLTNIKKAVAVTTRPGSGSIERTCALPIGTGSATATTAGAGLTDTYKARLESDNKFTFAITEFSFDNSMYQTWITRSSVWRNIRLRCETRGAASRKR